MRVQKVNQAVHRPAADCVTGVRVLALEKTDNSTEEIRPLDVLHPTTEYADRRPIRQVRQLWHVAILFVLPDFLLSGAGKAVWQYPLVRLLPCGFALLAIKFPLRLDSFVLPSYRIQVVVG
jgi:hypothetical protein